MSEKNYLCDLQFAGEELQDLMIELSGLTMRFYDVHRAVRDAVNGLCDDMVIRHGGTGYPIDRFVLERTGVLN